MLSNIKAPVLGLFFWLIQASVWAAHPPQRIVVLAPHAGELVCAAGACERIIGVVSYTDFPPQLRNLPRVGDYTRVNYEMLLKLKPDLIIAWKGGTPAHVIRRLQKMGFKVWLSAPEQLDDIPKEIKALGELLDTQIQANRVARILNTQLQNLKSRFINKTSLKVFYQLWYPPLMTVADHQFISQTIQLCGGENIFASTTVKTLTVSTESVVSRNPDVILLGGEKHLHPQWQALWQHWPMISAVNTKRIYEVKSDLLQRPGPRLIAGTAYLCWLLDKARQATSTH